MTLGRLYYLGRTFVRGGPRAVWGREMIAPRILKSAPIRPDRGCQNPQIEVHMLVWRGDWLTGLWAIRSLLHVTNQPLRLVIHDDGSCPPGTLAHYDRLFPGCKTISRIHADQLMEPETKAFPMIQHARRTIPHTLKVFDYASLSDGTRLLQVDPDILFFDEPQELLEASMKGSAAPARWNRDWGYGYSLPYETLRQATGVALKSRINSGLGTFVRASLAFPRLERWLSIPEIFTWHGCSGHVEQTLVALAACHHGFEFLPPPYDVHLGRTTPANAPCRHYTGPARQRFFSEGLWRLRRLPRV